MKKLLVVLLVLGLAAPAMAADFFAYGSVRQHLGWYNTSDDFGGGPAMDGSIAGGAAGAVPGATGADNGTLLSMGGQSRFGGKAVVSDALYGVVEFGFIDTERAGTAERPYLRLLYGEWNFGAGKLLVGHNYTPGTFLGYSGMHGDLGDQGDANMLVAGLAYIGRQPQIRLTFFNALEIAAIENNTAAVTYTGFADKDFLLPRLEAAYTFRTPIISIRPVAGYQTYKVENRATGDDKTIDSFMLGLGVNLTLGPAYVKMTGSWLQNAGNYGQSQLLVANNRGVALTNAQLVGGEIKDSVLWQGTGVVGVRFMPAMGIEAGVGYGDATVDTAVGTEASMKGWVYYLQLPITVAKGMQIIPEVGMLDRKELSVTGAPDVGQGKQTYVDVNFRVDF